MIAAALLAGSDPVQKWVEQRKKWVEKDEMRETSECPIW